MPVIATATPYELLSREELVELVKKPVGSNTELMFGFEKVKHELDQLKRLMYGSKHERFAPLTSPEQLALALNVEPNGTVEVVSSQKIEYTRLTTNVERKPPIGRQLLPAHLPRERVVIEPDIDLTHYKQIGEVVSEELNIKEAEFSVTQYVRPRYIEISSSEENQTIETEVITESEEEEETSIVIADLPPRPIDKCIAGASVLSHIIINKYVDHLPLDRQRKIFSRYGIDLPNPTIGGWVGQTSTGLVPLYEALCRLVFASAYLQADETTLKVQDKNKKGKTHLGYLWGYLAREERLVVFDYRPGRGREGPQDCLKNFKGHLQTDAYEAYEIFNGKEVTLFHCMAHARRYFDKAKDNDGKRAEFALTKMQQLYAIEQKAREGHYTHQQRYELRQKEALTILKEIEQWLKEEYPKVTPGSPIGKAINYSLSRWGRFILYTTDGKLEIDNNLIENTIRPVALGRKNFLFAGSHHAAQNTAMLYSLLGTCKLNNVNPKEWLTDVITRLPSYPVNRVEELLPHQWKPAPSPWINNKKLQKGILCLTQQKYQLVQGVSTGR